MEENKSYIHKCPEEGKKYESEQMKKLSKEMTDDIKQWIKIDKDFIIFDFGAGTGLLGLNFINDVKHVIFEDASSNMLDYLKIKCEQLNIKNYTIILGTIEEYKSNEKVDLILAGHVLHHIENLQQLFKNFLQIMKPHSYLCISDLMKDAPMFSLKGHNMPHKGFVPEELCQELKTAGFIRTEIKPASNIIFTTKEGESITSQRFIILAQSP